MRIARVAWLILGMLVASCAPTSGAPPSAAGRGPAEPAGSARAPAPTEATPVALIPITVHTFGLSVNTAIIQYGIEHGYYRDEGLDVTLQVADASVGVNLAASGHVDFTASVGSALAAAVRGVPIKVILATADRPLWWMYADPSITSVAGLRGKRIGSSSAGSSLTIVLNLILQKYGIGPDDATAVNLGSPQRLAALQAGAVDAGFLVAPTNLLAESAGFRQLFNSKDEGILLITEGLATSDAFLAEKPDIVHRMLRASLRAVRGMQTDRVGAIDTVARFTEISPEEAAQIYEFGLATWTPDGTAEPSVLRQSIEIMKLTAQVEGAVPEDQVFDLRMARELAAQPR
jgi:ABC-type nitrate/sulfonate/bicarbonate transport system substrate-binding protein